MSITLSALQKQRRDSAANWTAENPTLLAGEIGIESDTGKIKIGDGSTAWSSLGYQGIIPSSGAYPLSQLLMPSGTAGAPSISFDGDTNLGIYRSGTDQLSFTTAGTERLRIDATGQIEAVSLGTAAAPTFSFTGDPNTGIYSPGADQVAISTGGSGRLFVNSSGQVGIGGSPTSLFSVIGGNYESVEATYNYVQTRVSSGATGQFAVNGNTSVELRATTNHPLLFYTNNTERLRITSAGLVGIGTSTPSSRLDVYPAVVDGVAVTLRGNNATRGLEIGIKNDGALVDGIVNFNNLLSNGRFTWSAAGIERVRIDGQGNVGIGTTSPTDTLDVQQSGATCAVKATRSDASIAGGLSIQGGNIQNNLFSAGAKPLVIFTDSTERARIDSSGRLLVGTSSSNMGARLEVEGTDFAGSYANIRRNSADSSAPNLGFAKSRGTTNGSVTIVQNGDNLGQILFQGADGVTNIQAARITAAVDGTPGVNDMPGRLVFSTSADGSSSPTERLRIDSSGRVGIGTSPWNPLSVQLPTTPHRFGFGLGVTGDADLTLYRWLGTATDYRSANIACRQDGSISFSSSTGYSDFSAQSYTERARIDSSGRLLVGTSSGSGIRLQQNASFVVTGDMTYGGALFAGYSGATFTDASPNLDVCRSRGTSAGSFTKVENGDRLGGLNFRGADGTGFIDAASIVASVDGGTGTNDMPGRLVFSTTADGASSPTERMRIDNAGKTYFGTTNNNPYGNSVAGTVIDGAGTVNSSANGTYSAVFNRMNSDGQLVLFGRNGTTVGNVSVTTTATAYNTSSDYRLKDNISPVTDGITRLQQLKPSRFNFIADPAKTVDGFLAHEVQTVVPEAITGEKDAVDNEGNPIYQGIDQSKLVPLLTAALQEAIGEIESLKARVAALESA